MAGKSSNDLDWRIQTVDQRLGVHPISGRRFTTEIELNGGGERGIAGVRRQFGPQIDEIDSRVRLLDTYLFTPPPGQESWPPEIIEDLPEIIENLVAAGNRLLDSWREFENHFDPGNDRNACALYAQSRNAYSLVDDILYPERRNRPDNSPLSEADITKRRTEFSLLLDDCKSKIRVQEILSERDDWPETLEELRAEENRLRKEWKEFEARYGRDTRHTAYDQYLAGEQKELRERATDNPDKAFADGMRAAAKLEEALRQFEHTRYDPSQPDGSESSPTTTPPITIEGSIPHPYTPPK